MMDHCVICGRPIETNDWMVAIETHAPPGQKGCSVTIRIVNEEVIDSIPQYATATRKMYEDAPALGSASCAQLYVRQFLFEHMRDSNAQGNKSSAIADPHKNN